MNEIPSNEFPSQNAVARTETVTLPMADNMNRHFTFSLDRDELDGSRRYLYTALAMSVRDRLVERWKKTRHLRDDTEPRQVHYLSLEFLMGRTLGNAILNLDMEDEIRDTLKNYGCTLEELAQEEHDAGLGNGGLGRLAACFLDSCASLDLPVTGYGIRYEYGMFAQKIISGHQVEAPDQWLNDGHPWEVERPEATLRVKFLGHTEHQKSENGKTRVTWENSHDVLAVPFDVPVPGYQNDVVNTLRLWKSRATEEFNLSAFNAGSYADAVASRTAAEQISMVLYPNDASENGKELRLRQQYFLASASLQDVMCRWASKHGDDFSRFAELNCFQMNDTHPTIAVAEMMRLLMDEYHYEWDEAWEIIRQTMAYTNHTLLPEALEKWSVGLMGYLLPRMLEIILEINARFLEEVSLHWPGDLDKQRQMSIIEEGPERQVRMAHLAIVASFSINGVAELHTDLLKQGLFKNFYELWPEKFNNKTNGVTPRRWMHHCNPGLHDLITKSIGQEWKHDFKQIEMTESLIENEEFREQWQSVKLDNKKKLAEMVQQDCDVAFDPSMMFDVQVKRIHEYKRQLLNILHVIHLYDRIRTGKTEGLQPRCVLIGGKAAPGYAMAKLIIKLINNVAAVVNADETVQPWLRVAFLPNYRVSAMEVICPGTDLSEQVSTAGKEASGTGNMKFMMNGALTIGTLDGANIEIRDAVGEENFFLFGLNAAEVERKRQHYNPDQIIAEDADLARVMKLIEGNHFSEHEHDIFASVINAISNPHDAWMTAADFRSYVDCQSKVDLAYQDQDIWTRMSIINTARSAHFSSDRTISEYATDIWKIKAKS